MESLELILRKLHKPVFVKDGISIIQVENAKDGSQVAKDVLYALCDEKTALFLSGGKTPKLLYEKLAHEEKLRIGALAMIDERFGKPMHDKSNEKLIAKTGLLRYLEIRDIPFYSILQNKKSLALHLQGVKLNIESVAKEYDEIIRTIIFNIPKSVGVLGIGVDGHTAGLPAKVQNLEFRIQNDLVVALEDFPGDFRERITLTFKALELFDVFLVLVFDSAKQNALKKMFENGSVEEIPARFYVQDEISKKTILITDQTI